MLSQEEALSATDARKNFSLVLDMAMRKPVSIKRREEIFIAFSLRQLADSVPFTLIFEENAAEGQPFVYFEEMPNVIGYGENIEAMIEDFAYALADYAEIYLADFERHYYASNLKGQLLQVSILADMSLAEIGGFIRAKLERIRTISDK